MTATPILLDQARALYIVQVQEVLTLWPEHAATVPAWEQLSAAEQQCWVLEAERRAKVVERQTLGAVAHAAFEAAIAHQDHTWDVWVAGWEAAARAVRAAVLAEQPSVRAEDGSAWHEEPLDDDDDERRYREEQRHG